MGALTFYFDKNCTEKATEKLKEIFRENGLIGVSGFTGYSDNRNKKWICYNLSNRMTEEFQVIDENLNNKVNDIVRNFDWESIGVTGFEEAILEKRRKIERKNYVCCDTAETSCRTFWKLKPINGMAEKVGEPLAIRIPTLRNNPNGVEFSLSDIPVGSIVKICDGEERFWVRVTEIGTDCYFGEIINNLICDKGYGRGDMVVFNLEHIYDVEKPKMRVFGTEEPKLDLIFGVTRQGFIEILNDCSKELKLANSDICEAIYLIIVQICRGMNIIQIMSELRNPPILFAHQRNSVSVLGKLALSILNSISNRYNKIAHTIYAVIPSTPYHFLKNDVVKPVLECILKECNTPEDAQEGIFKSGDKVFFIKQSIHGNGNEPYRINLYLGIVKNWTVCPHGKIQCIFDNVFNIMELETLDLDVCNSEDVKELIEADDFSKAIVKSNTKSVYGDITLCPVDESLFPKLNKILASINGIDDSSEIE